MSLSGFSSGFGFPDVDLDSDDSIEDYASSEDEIDIILHGTPEQRRKLKHFYDKGKLQQARLQHGSKVQNKSDSSSEDEFEKQMNAELNDEVSVLENARGHKTVFALPSTKHQSSSSSVTSQKGKSSSQSQRTSEKQDFYDEIYFDSDEEDESMDAPSSRKPKYAMISNDDLLYDPDMDDEDQKWVDQQRRKHYISPGTKGKGKAAKVPNSDALLDCPACMTTLSIDCQRHDTYKNQYRAMFVMNCAVDKTETLQCPEQGKKRNNKRKRKQQMNENSSTSGAPNDTDLFNPVRCTECKTVVGVIDHEEIYHFFNVLASHT